MQLRYVFTELGQGLRRNVSMHLAVVLTLFVSLTLVGMGALVQQQANKTSDFWGNQLQVIVYLCNDSDAKTSPNCTGAISEAQQQVVEETIRANPEVDSLRVESQQQAYEKAKELIPEAFADDELITPENMRQGVWITLKDPEKYEGVVSAVRGLDGVHSINDMRDQLGMIFKFTDILKYGSFGTAAFLVLAALLLVANTIRLAAFARRKEIGIMRLVGASTLYIALPFLLEALVTAVIGVAMAAVALWAAVRFGIDGYLADEIGFIPWIGTEQLAWALGIIAVLGPLLTIIPTLILTRKYLKV